MTLDGYKQQQRDKINVTNGKRFMGISINGGIQKWLVYHGKSHLEIDDLGVKN